MFIPVGVLTQRTMVGAQTVFGHNREPGGVDFAFESHGVAVFVKRGRV